MSDVPQINIGNGFSFRVFVYASILFLAVGICLGAWGEYTWGPRLTDRHTIEKPVITEKVVTQTDTKIVYVPKEVIKYVNAQGQTVTQPLDGKFTFNKPEFMFTVNGKPGKFTKSDDERFVFDKNMLQLTQTSVIKIEAEIPAIDKTKYFGFGIGAGMRDSKVIDAFFLEGRLNKDNHTGWWLYTDGRILQNVITGKPPRAETITGGIAVKF
jgi:hypothetical protein